MIHNMSKRSIKDFFYVIQDENNGSNDEEGKLLDLIAWPCRAVKRLLRNIVYDDFKEISQAVAPPPQDIFLEKSSTSQFRQNGPLYPESFTESGRVKAITNSEKVAPLEGRWDSPDLFAYSFPLRFEYKF